MSLLFQRFIAAGMIDGSQVNFNQNLPLTGPISTAPSTGPCLICPIDTLHPITLYPDDTGVAWQCTKEPSHNGYILPMFTNANLAAFGLADPWATPIGYNFPVVLPVLPIGYGAQNNG